MKKSKIFKKFLAVIISGVTLCSSNLAVNKTYAQNLSTETKLKMVATSLSGLSLIIGSVATIVLMVNTTDLSDEIQKKETEIINLEAQISRIESNIRNANQANRMQLETQLQGLQQQLSTKLTELSNLNRNYRDSCQDLQFVERHNHFMAHHTLYPTTIYCFN